MVQIWLTCSVDHENWFVKVLYRVGYFVASFFLFFLSPDPLGWGLDIFSWNKHVICWYCEKASSILKVRCFQDVVQISLFSTSTCRNDPLNNLLCSSRLPEYSYSLTHAPQKYVQCSIYFWMYLTCLTFWKPL